MNLHTWLWGQTNRKGVCVTAKQEDKRKASQRAIHRADYAAHKEQRLAYQRAYYAAHRDERLAYDAARRAMRTL